MHTTNYYDTFIEAADDCPVGKGEKPPEKAQRTIAGMEYDLIAEQPYQYTSDDVLFDVFARRNDIPDDKREEERERFFSRGQPCFRASPLTKRYGWGVHFDSDAKMAIYGIESKKYHEFKKDKKLNHVTAVRSRRA